MKLGLNDLHPRVVDVLKARMWSLRFAQNARPEDAGPPRVLAKRWKALGWRILGASALGATVTGGPLPYQEPTEPQLEV